MSDQFGMPHEYFFHTTVKQAYSPLRKRGWPPQGVRYAWLPKAQKKLDLSFAKIAS